MKVLFLDDNLERHKEFAKGFGDDSNEIWYVETASDAIEVLNEIKFDSIFLDHDLGGEYFVPSGDGTGYEVAEWLSENLDYNPIIIIHSMNPSGAVNMKNKLSGCGFKPILYPFSCLMGKY